MAKKKIALLLIPAAALILAGCGDTGSSSTTLPGSSGSDTTSSIGGGSSDSSSSSTLPATEYQVNVPSKNGVTITADKETAKAGDTVTLTITLQDGYSLTGLTVNGEEIPFEATGTTFTITFTMPDFDAHIDCTLALTNATVSIGGDIVAAMTEENGVYVAKNVQAVNTSNIYIAVAGENGAYTYFAYGELARTKCFGEITYSDLQFNEVTLPGGAITGDQATDSLIELGGNAAYDITYAPAAGEVYIQRVDVLNLPSTPEAFESLFAGNILSESSNYPANVNAVTFSDNLTGNDYSWKLYANNTSLATVTNEDRGTTSYVYKTVKDGVYTIVDNYIEGVTYTNPYSDGRTNLYVDDSASEDTYAYSGKYNVVDVVESGTRDHQISEEDALFTANHYSHDMYSIDRMQWEGYRSSYSLEDDLVDAGRVVTSVENDDGSFTTTISSYKTFDPVNVSSAYARMTERTHIEYDIVTTFTAAGAPLEGSYREMKYGENEYNFDDGEFYPGMEQNGGTLVKRFNYTYSYGDADTTAPTFDADPYFATAVTAHLEDSDGNDVTSTPVNGGWSTADDEPALVIEATGENASTALDTWQYGVVSSSSNVFVPDEWTQGVYVASNTVTGTATLTLGNFVDNNAAGTIDITVENAPVHGFYLTSEDPWTEDWHLTSADTAQLYGGTTWVAGLHSAGEDNANLNNVTATSSDESALTVSIDVENRTIAFTAAPTTTQKTVTVTITSTDYEEGWGDGYDVFAITILPGNGMIENDDIVGDWRVELSEDVYDYNPDDPTVLSFHDDGTGSLTLEDATWTASYSFNWEYDSNTNALNVTGIQKVSGTGTFDYYQMFIAIEIAGQDAEGNNLYKLGSIFFGAVDDLESYTTTITDILGSYSTDEEGYLDPNYSEYVFFVNTSLVD